MPLRTIENRPGVVYDASKKYRIFAEDLQGLDERITTIEDEGGGGGSGSGVIGNPFYITSDLETLPYSVYFLWDILEIADGISFEIGTGGYVAFLEP